MWIRVWNDEGGAILSAELILLMTMLVIGLIAGLHAVQTAAVTELSDVGQALGNLSQSYGFTGFAANGAFTNTVNGVNSATTNGPLSLGSSTPLAATSGSLFADPVDLNGTGAQTRNTGITVVAPVAENAGFAGGGF
jgi:hypothetical protein